MSSIINDMIDAQYQYLNNQQRIIISEENEPIHRLETMESRAREALTGIVYGTKNQFSLVQRVSALARGTLCTAAKAYCFASKEDAQASQLRRLADLNFDILYHNSKGKAATHFERIENEFNVEKIQDQSGHVHYHSFLPAHDVYDPLLSEKES